MIESGCGGHPVGLVSPYSNNGPVSELARDMTLKSVACYFPDSHYDVIKWKYFPRYWPFVRRIHRSPVNSPHKGQWRGALMISLICNQINGWVNNGEAGDLRRHCAHYDVIVMSPLWQFVVYSCGSVSAILGQLPPTSTRWQLHVRFKISTWWQQHLPAQRQTLLLCAQAGVPVSFGLPCSSSWFQCYHAEDDVAKAWGTPSRGLAKHRGSEDCVW